MTRLIDADSLKEGIAELKRSPWYKNRMIPSIHAGIKEALEVVELLCIDKEPTIDAVPVRHGKFIGTESDGYADGYPVYNEWKCSECGCVFEEEEPTYRYCPNCGARMDKE